MKKARSASDGPPVTTAAADKEKDADAGTMTASTGSSSSSSSNGGAKSKKRAIHWADEAGGLLREVRTIEVEKIKRSTAMYSNTRELSKKERLSEKEVNLSKV